MDASQWASFIVSLVALSISALTAYVSWRGRRDERKRAELTVYFHRNSEMAKVARPDGTTKPVGYNLVLWNRGPAPATSVSFRVYGRNGMELELIDLAADELPLPRLEPGTLYPIPWLLSQPDKGRFFRCDLSWTDESGARATSVPLRRGETRQ